MTDPNATAITAVAMRLIASATIFDAPSRLWNGHTIAMMNKANAIGAKTEWAK